LWESLSFFALYAETQQPDAVAKTAWPCVDLLLKIHATNSSELLMAPRCCSLLLAALAQCFSLLRRL